MDARGSGRYPSGHVLNILFRMAIAERFRLLDGSEFETRAPKQIFPLSNVLDCVGSVVSGKFVYLLL